MVPLSPAKALLVAVQLAHKSEIPQLRTLLSQTTLQREVVFRLLLTNLPETLPSAEYVPLIQDLINGTSLGEEVAGVDVDISALEGLGDQDAKRAARRLRLLPLRSPSSPEDIPDDPLVLFLIHRSLQIDERTGLIAQIPPLLSPFLEHSNYLRTWLISCVLPLQRLNYEYYLDEISVPSIPIFDSLSERDAVTLLLSRTGHHVAGQSGLIVGRDLRGLIGPWMHGHEARESRQRLKSHQRVTPGGMDGSSDSRKWEEVFKWILKQGIDRWETAVHAIEQWDGPGDVDLGGLEDGMNWADEDEQQYLEMRYARSMLATAYSISQTSSNALSGAGRILSRLTTLMDLDKLPTIEQAAALLMPISINNTELLTPATAAHLRNNLINDSNPLTAPSDPAIQLAHALSTSSYILARAGVPLNLRAVGELALIQDKAEQNAELTRFIMQAGENSKHDDSHWTRTRNEVLWLRNWGIDQQEGNGPFGRLPLDGLEKTMLEAMIKNSRYELAKTMYETSSTITLPRVLLQETIVSSALQAFENATNANKTRGGVKKSGDILAAFQITLARYPPAEQLKQLINVTHTIGTYKLVFKQGEPFKPIQLLVHNDPIGIIGKILDQNPSSYSNLNDFMDIGEGMVRAGLLSKSALGYSILRTLDSAATEKAVSETRKRVVGMCIDAALSEDDFETAYSYVVTRLKAIAGPAHARSPGPQPTNNGLFPDVPPKIIDDWSWRAALQAGKYRRTGNTLKPTHLGNANANPDIRHLEQRLECLAQALRLAPKATLQEILNVYRRCEEELESLLKQEAEQADAWDSQGDSAMPGGFEATPLKKNAATRAVPNGSEEAPLSLFDLSRASVMRAQSGFASLAQARNTQHHNQVQQPRVSGEDSRTSTPDSTAAPVRKRDQFRNAAVGSLASGVGWILGAQPVRNSSEEER